MALLTNPLMTGFDQGVDAPLRWTGVVPDDARAPLTVGSPPEDDRPAWLRPDPGADAARDVVEQTYAKMQAAQQGALDQGQWTGGQVWEGGHPTGAGMLDAASQYALGLGTKDLDVGGVPGIADRVSTRIPYAKPAKNAPPPIDPHSTPDLNISIDAMRAAPDTFDKNVQLLRGPDYPDLPIKGMRNTDNIADKSVDHMADNLVWLHDRMQDQFGPDMVHQASQWYDGANNIARLTWVSRTTCRCVRWPAAWRRCRLRRIGLRTSTSPSD